MFTHLSFHIQVFLSFSFSTCVFVFKFHCGKFNLVSLRCAVSTCLWLSFLYCITFNVIFFFWIILNKNHCGVYACSILLMTSFTCNVKTARGVDFTCWWHLSIFVPNSILQKTMAWGITWFLLGVIIAFFHNIKQMYLVLSIQHQWV